MRVHLNLFDKNGTDAPNNEFTTLVKAIRKMPENNKIIGEVNSDTKKKLRGITIANFEPGKGRSIEAFVETYFLGFDFDDGELSWGDIQGRLEKEGLSYLIYTTPSHTPEHPKLRVFLPLAEPITCPERYKDVLLHADKTLFGGHHDKNAMDVSRFFYGPTKIDGQMPIIKDKTDGNAYVAPEVIDIPEPAIDTSLAFTAVDSDDDDCITPERLAEVLKWTDGSEQGVWIKKLWAILGEVKKSGFDKTYINECYEVFDEWSATQDGYDSSDNLKTWKRELKKLKLGREHPNPITMGSLIMEAREAGMPAPERKKNKSKAKEMVGKINLVSQMLNFQTDIMDQDHPEKATVIRGMLTEGDSAMIWSPAGVGKSQFVNYIAAMAANGYDDEDQAFGAPEPIKVLMIDGEMRCSENKARMQMVLKGMPEGSTLDNVDTFNMKKVIQSQYVDEDGNYRDPLDDTDDEDTFDYATFNVANPLHQLALVDAVRQIGYKLVIIDNLRSLATFKGAEENAAESANQINPLIDRLSAIDVCTILIHHSGKTTRELRKKPQTFSGSANFERPHAAMFSIYEVDEFDEETGFYSLGLQVFKRRHAGIVDQAHLTISREFGFNVTKGEPVSQDDNEDLQQLYHWAKYPDTCEHTSHKDLLKYCVDNGIVDKMPSKPSRTMRNTIRPKLLALGLSSDEYEAFHSHLSDKARQENLKKSEELSEELCPTDTSPTDGDLCDPDDLW